MFSFSTKKFIVSLLTLGAVLLAGFWYWQSTQSTAPPRTIEVTRGDVLRSVSASGVTESNTTATLGFPVVGTLATLPVSENDTVVADQVLATLQTTSIDAEIAEAQASLTEALARQRELLAGSTDTTRAISDTQVSNAADALERTRTTQAQLLQAAREKLLSADLTATAVDPEETEPAPAISGTYSCTATGTYNLEVFRSNADSNYSVRVTGLESTTVPVSFTQPVPFGDCGLRMQFTTGTSYHDTRWRVTIPNENASSYLTNLNAYETAQTNASSAIAAATDALTLAERQAADVTAPTRAEQLEQANARVAGADARLNRLRVRRADHTLRASTGGTVTNIDATVGEIVDRPFLTLLGTTNTFELKARIAEVDITYIEAGDPVRIEFDARPNERYAGTVTNVSPLPTQIEGVAYFTATITFTDPPRWLRSGLNADVAIVTEQKTNVLRVPQGFISDLTGSAPYVHVWHGDETTSTTTVTVDLIGTDGMASITNLEPGTTLVSP